MRASLADQSLAIALGANLPSPAGPPIATLQAVRPLLQELVLQLGVPGRWSPLFRTAPVGGPADQPGYLNAVVLVKPAIPSTPPAALELLANLQALERRFGRQRRQRWGPRSLDLDLLWWSDLHCCSETLELPHPRLLERTFVLAPLEAIEAELRLPGAGCSATDLLMRLQQTASGAQPQRLPGRPGWPE